MTAAVAFGALSIVAACDGGGPSVDASAPVGAYTSAVSLRIDVSSDKQASLSVLAFRALFSGVPAADVLGMVDPLAANAPDHDCQVRDVDHAAAALVARGDAIELEELSGIAVRLGSDAAVEIRPSPRLYPDLAATIGGVVGEAGPVGLALMPEQVRVQGGLDVLPQRNAITDPGADATDAAVLGVPATGWVRTVNGTAPRDGMLIPISADVNLSLAPVDATETSIELRPFGATVALSCVVPMGSAASGGQISFVVPRHALDTLRAASGTAPGASVAAALDLVRRSSTQLPLSATHLSLEVRTSTFVELLP